MPKKNAHTKDYMLRSRLNQLEKSQLELLIHYYQIEKNIKLTKVDVLRHLVGKEFEEIQMDMVVCLAPVSH